MWGFLCKIKIHITHCGRSRSVVAAHRSTLVHSPKSFHIKGMFANLILLSFKLDHRLQNLKILLKCSLYAKMNECIWITFKRKRLDYNPNYFVGSNHCSLTNPFQMIVHQYLNHAILQPNTNANWNWYATVKKNIQNERTGGKPAVFFNFVEK